MTDFLEISGHLHIASVVTNSSGNVCAHKVIENSLGFAFYEKLLTSVSKEEIGEIPQHSFSCT